MYRCYSLECVSTTNPLGYLSCSVEYWEGFTGWVYILPFCTIWWIIWVMFFWAIVTIDKLRWWTRILRPSLWDEVMLEGKLQTFRSHLVTFQQPQDIAGGTCLECRQSQESCHKEIGHVVSQGVLLRSSSRRPCCDSPFAFVRDEDATNHRYSCNYLEQGGRTTMLALHGSTQKWSGSMWQTAPMFNNNHHLCAKIHGTRHSGLFASNQWWEHAASIHPGSFDKINSYLWM